jgi:hypothetical protein
MKSMSLTHLHIPTLEDTLASQGDLAVLCADRPLQTKEIFPGNAFYGIDSILKLYAGLPLDYALKVIMPHGINHSPDHLWESERVISVPVILYYPPYRKQIYTKKTNKRLVPSASPYLYVIELMKQSPQPERRGTIFFPSHSTHHLNVDMDFNELAEGLTGLPQKYHPVTVCIYWKDCILGHHLPFRERGFDVVSAGHMYDPLFLFRLYHLLSMHTYAASNSIGSNLYYSVKSGCSFFYFLDEIEIQHRGDMVRLQQDRANPPEKDLLLLRQLFKEPHPASTPEQLKLVDYYLGTEYLKSPRALLMQLLYAELLDKCYFYTRDRDREQRLFMPSCYRRHNFHPLQRTVHVTKRILSSLLNMIRPS